MVNLAGLAHLSISFENSDPYSGSCPLFGELSTIRGARPLFGELGHYSGSWESVI